MAEASAPISWWDEAYCAADRIVLTARDLQIPGLRVFGWHDMKYAVPPLRPHFHEHSFEIVFVTKGNISFYVDQKEYSLYGGDAFLTFPDEIHHTNGIPMSVGEIFWMQLDVSQTNNFLYLNAQAADALLHMLLQLKQHCIRTDLNKITNAAKTLQHAILNTPLRNPFQIANYVVTFLYLLLSYTSLTSLQVSLDIVRACEYIDRHITEPLTLEEIAGVCCISLPQFKAKFKAQVGVSPRSYINQEKIKRIKGILTRRSNLTEVAGDFGFCNSAYFSVVFKKYTAQTPTEYMASLPE